jgi:hypothetical protein
MLELVAVLACIGIYINSLMTLRVAEKAVEQQEAAAKRLEELLAINNPNREYL